MNMPPDQSLLGAEHRRPPVEGNRESNEFRHLAFQDRKHLVGCIPGSVRRIKGREKPITRALEKWVCCSRQTTAHYLSDLSDQVRQEGIIFLPQQFSRTN